MSDRRAESRREARERRAAGWFGSPGDFGLTEAALRCRWCGELCPADANLIGVIRYRDAAGEPFIGGLVHLGSCMDLYREHQSKVHGIALTMSKEFYGL